MRDSCKVLNPHVNPCITFSGLSVIVVWLVGWLDFEGISTVVDYQSSLYIYIYIYIYIYKRKTIKKFPIFL